MNLIVKLVKGSRYQYPEYELYTESGERIENAQFVEVKVNESSIARQEGLLDVEFTINKKYVKRD